MAACIHPNYQLSGTIKLVDTLLEMIPLPVFIKHPNVFRRLKYYRNQAIFTMSLTLTNVGLMFEKKEYLSQAQAREALMTTSKGRKLSEAKVLAQYKMSKNASYNKGIREVVRKLPTESKDAIDTKQIFSVIGLGSIGVESPAQKQITKVGRQKGGGLASDLLNNIAKTATPFNNMILHSIVFAFPKSLEHTVYDPNTKTISMDMQKASKDVEESLIFVDIMEFVILIPIFTMYMMGAALKEDSPHIRKLIRLSTIQMFGGKKQTVPTGKKLFGIFPTSIDAMMALKTELIRLAQAECESDRNRSFSVHDYLRIYDIVNQELQILEKESLVPTFSMTFHLVKEIVETSKVILTRFMKAKGIPLTMQDPVPVAVNAVRANAKVPKVSVANAVRANAKVPVVANAVPNAKAPKVAVNAAIDPRKTYVNFMKQNRTKVQIANPNMKAQQVNQELSKMWRNLTQDEKNTYKVANAVSQNTNPCLKARKQSCDGPELQAKGCKWVPRKGCIKP